MWFGWQMERWEIMSDMIEEFNEWVDFEEDLKTNPWGD